MKGTDDIEVPVKAVNIQGGENWRAIMDADVFISLTHFKGHEMTGFGGAIKNIGMGCGSRAGKKDQHNDGKPSIDPEKCGDAAAAYRSVPIKAWSLTLPAKKCGNQNLVLVAAGCLAPVILMPSLLTAVRLFLI